MKRRVVTSVLVGLVLVGSIFLGKSVGIGQEGELMPFIFLGFFALIIAIQVVPAVLLFGVLLKEVFTRRSAKAKEDAGVPTGNSN